MDIGKKIKQLRFKASLTQEQLAEKLGLSAQAVSKWENSVAMPDISLLPELAQVFGVSIDELFDLTAQQKLRRIENRMDVEDELEPDVFREYEEFLKVRLQSAQDRQQILSLLAQLYHHRLEADSRKVCRFAREAIMLQPGKKDCQWLLIKGEGAAGWDWNFANHSKTIDFYKSVIASDDGEPKSPLPYYYLLDNLLADHRSREAAEYLMLLKRLPAHKPFLIPVYEAAIALAGYDEAKADAIIEKALATYPDDPGMLFEAAQYYARKCDYDRAIRYYEASYDGEANEKPRFTDALEAVSMIHEIRGEDQKAADVQCRILDALKTEWGFTEETIVRETQREIERLRQKQQSRPAKR